MPEDVGGTPFPDGWEPDDDHDHGVPDEEFASVVFDEAFVQAATVHEPSAVERLLAAAQARAEASEAEARRARARSERYDDRYDSEGTDLSQDQDDDELDDTYVLDDGHGPFARKVRWHRPVAWVLAVVMGIGMVALAFAAVYRGGSSGARDRVPAPAATGVEQGSSTAPSISAETSQPAVSAVPRTP
ncbi:SCO2584 family spore wall biosynthesis protein [Streptomyces broussonetiae]|uniref:SCO2584 family spore wall biosynthesis protein n=1 Tax=Streptomyces broussonetiae TaxID=2686304 RepID=UPI0040647B36